ncbi:NAD(P)/FAD-dependent oxidoreductase [Embleya scabrispora]|uniref:NAD(P)/FAD-dependent oxidoreductase n=1 Tax=Embleya scabrispora TaxID=159449 RepID=UPI00037CD27C|nr:FAD-dependent oxidoreductase [Embleya scabrispora]MYS82789.1 FAD-dependent oxidoreductase [Streptomyces sp. SID5474]
MDVAIVGGGVIGSAAAYYLARSGADVVVVEPAPGRGASAGNAGLVVPSYSLPMSNPGVLLAGVRSLWGADPAATLSRPLSLRTLLWLGRFAVASRPGRAMRDARRLGELAAASMRLYDDLLNDLEVCSHSSGFLHVARDPAIWQAERKAASRLAGLGIRHEVLDAAALANAEPGMADGFAGAVRFPDDRALDPAAVTNAVLAAAVRSGAVVRTDRVVGVRMRDRRADAIETTGGPVRARAFVLAAGADSAAVGRLFGLRLKVEAGYGWSLTLPAPNRLLDHALMCADDHVILTSTPGRLRLTGGMEFGGPPGAPKAEAIARLRAVAERALPAVRRITADGTAWRGARPMTPSGLPVIRRFGGDSGNVVVATGHGTLGLTLAPATGRIVARLLAPTQKGSVGTSSRSL